MSMKSIASEIAKCLGEGFVVENDAEVNDRSAIIRKIDYDKQFGIILYHDTYKKKFEIKGRYPISTDGVLFPRTGLFNNISMSDQKVVSKIAKDIQNRFLDDYIKIFNDAVLERDKHQEWVEKRNTNLQMFAELLNGVVRGEKVEQKGWDSNQSEMKGYLNNFMVSATTCQIEFRSVPIDVMKKILEVWKEL